MFKTPCKNDDSDVDSTESASVVATGRIRFRQQYTSRENKGFLFQDKENVDSEHR